MTDVTLPAGVATPDQAAVDTAWRRVQLARHPQRPRTLDFVSRIFDDFVELHGDRSFRDDPAIVGGPARLDGRAVMVIGHQKGNDTESNIFRNFGSAHPEGFRKAQRLMRIADKLGVPLITFLDTAGAFPGPAAEERGQAESIASSIKLMTGLQVPIVVVIVGEGGSGGALAMGVGDRVLALENAVYSVISPEGCAAILWRQPEAAPIAAAAMRMTAADQLELGVIDQIIDEPDEGAHANPDATAAAVKTAIIDALASLGELPTAGLLVNRYARLRRTGPYIEAGGPAIEPEPPSLTRRLGRILRLPGVPRRPRWSEIWPSGENGDEDES
jgi:acetyl-CoA carboxylase carboxyl transferase subunit alpha